MLLVRKKVTQGEKTRPAPYHSHINMSDFLIFYPSQIRNSPFFITSPGPRNSFE